MFFVSAQKKDSLLKTILAEPNDIEVLFGEDGEPKGTSGFVPSPLHAAKELLNNAISFRFAAARFSYRGLDARSFSVRMNGIKMNRLYDQQIPWNHWGGLNESMSNQTVFTGVGELDFGSIGMNNDLQLAATSIRSQRSITVANGNRAYGNRIAFTRASSFNKKGLALAMEFSGRKGGEQLLNGGFLNSLSYLVSIQKKFSVGSINVLFIGASLSRNTTPATTNEYRLIGGRKTNPYWGYQDGRKRNASVFYSHQPKIIVSTTISPNENTIINGALMYSSGLQYTTGFDWYNAPDPRSDYYRYMPSYQQDSLLQLQVQQQLAENPAILQINWHRLYDINRNNLQTINSVTGNRATYIIESRNRNTKQISFAANLQQQITASDSWKIGVDFSVENNHFFKTVHDLLGADYYVNWNQFGSSNIPNSTSIQNDLNNPDGILYQGSIVGYSYALQLKELVGYTSWITRKQQLDIDIGAMVSFTNYQRVGYMRNGLFPGNSFGEAQPISFSTTGFKAGITYKQSGRQYFFSRVLVFNRPPLVQHVFVSARINQLLHPVIQNEHFFQLEIGWMYNGSKAKYRLNAYGFQKRNGIELLSFYHDEYKSLVSYAISGINQLHLGIEASLSYSVTPSINVEAVALLGNYKYTQAQQFATYIDNETSAGEKGDIFIKNFKVSGTPQQAYTIGLSYKPGKWWANFAINHLRDYWLDVNPLRRSYSAGIFQTQANTDWIFPQEKLPNIVYADAFIGTSFYLNKKSSNSNILFFLSINNCFNNIFYSGGYEQLRLGVTATGNNKFPTKYFLSPGIAYSLTTRINF